jgi:hypothetical protein
VAAKAVALLVAAREPLGEVQEVLAAALEVVDHQALENQAHPQRVLVQCSLLEQVQPVHQLDLYFQAHQQIMDQEMSMDFLVTEAITADMV